MKRLALLLVLVLLLGACAGSGSNSEDAAATTELALNRSAMGSIASVGEVDWYHYRVVEANSILRVNCSGKDMRPEVDLLVTLYEEDPDGNKIRLYADHAMEDSQLPADISIYLYIDRPKDIYIAVRDLTDDDASGQPYYLSIDFETPAEGNESFAQATPIEVDDPNTCQIDHIGAIGDLDCFLFDTPSSGIYAVKVDFSPFAGGTDVNLGVELYDADGVRVESLTGAQNNSLQMLPYLDAGRHYVLVKDQGHDDFDTASYYNICVDSVAGDEAFENDSAATATAMAYESSTRTFSASGSVAYTGDEDWYALPLSGLSTSGLKVLNVRFDDAAGDPIVFNYQLALQ
ncbi:MAG: hypothetical protein HKO68_01350, partial [Desulfobacterales bacterium]|nr:hypothetical protein [Desulfobacterales bacterium]